jgi:hypothetical protein
MSMMCSCVTTMYVCWVCYCIWDIQRTMYARLRHSCKFMILNVFPPNLLIVCDVCPRPKEQFNLPVIQVVVTLYATW